MHVQQHVVNGWTKEGVVMTGEGRRVVCGVAAVVAVAVAADDD